MALVYRTTRPYPTSTLLDGVCAARGKPVTAFMFLGGSGRLLRIARHQTFVSRVDHDSRAMWSYVPFWSGSDALHRWPAEPLPRSSCRKSTRTPLDPNRARNVKKITPPVHLKPTHAVPLAQDGGERKLQILTPLRRRPGPRTLLLNILPVDAYEAYETKWPRQPSKKECPKLDRGMLHALRRF